MVRSGSLPCFGPVPTEPSRRPSIYVASAYDGQVEIYPTSVRPRVSMCSSLVKNDTGFVPSHAGAVTCRYPVRIWTPRIANRTHKCTWLYGSQFGGGMVEGDQIKCKITVKDRCCALYATVGHNKIYSCAEGIESRQLFEYNIGNDACLLVLPEPSTLQKDADLSQTQEVKLAHTGNVVLLDWYTAGRSALGEHWDFRKLRTCNVISRDDEEIYRDVVMFNEDTSSELRKAGMGENQVFGSCVIIGKVVMDQMADKIKELPTGTSHGNNSTADQIVTSSPLYSDLQDKNLCGYVLRFCFTSTIEAYETISEVLKPIMDLAGGNPFERSF